ncbi:hypothetical protein [Desulfomonile tiedjei]|uniref:DUF4142 domain-containing protein n=1 Tax=Desulfomonile tiedjei (strain ATCC 49306 / DSM 6799 / DCB-1) TaxID=706587 RepID=I4CD37_DESTA|nr:hypothetical protein [Desulfomonile tiedjei]AFM27478.1 hypothetical protein Desti_4864 [Desulfomonile tiedjei DSM 6799]
MKNLILFFSLGLFIIAGPAQGSDQAVFLNAFGETATAYLNDSFLLLGTTADGFVANIVSKETANEIVKNVQKRVRVIRAKLKAVSNTRISDVDRRLIGLLEQSYACMDHQAWALMKYLAEKSPDSARRFESQRTECLQKLKRVAEFYSTLPPSPELPEPLSTR